MKKKEKTYAWPKKHRPFLGSFSRLLSLYTVPNRHPCRILSRPLRLWFPPAVCQWLSSGLLMMVVINKTIVVYYVLIILIYKMGLLSICRGGRKEASILRRMVNGTLMIRSQLMFIST